MGSSPVEIHPASRAAPKLTQIEQVRLALSQREMGSYLQGAFRQPGPRRNKLPVCRIVDMKYEPGDYCTLLYQYGEQMVVGHMQWSDGVAVSPQSAHRIEALEMELYPYPRDPWLPGLEIAAEPKSISLALAEALPECRSGQARILRVLAVPQRYRPGKRFTVRLDVSFRDQVRGEIFSRRYYGKVYHDPKKAMAAYQELQLLAGIPAARDGKVVLAPPAAYLPGLSMVLQGPVSGTPLEDLIGRMEGHSTMGDPRGWDGIQRAAAALAAVHTAGLEAGRHRPIQDELSRFQKRAAKVRLVDGSQGEVMGELARALPAWLGWLDEWGAESSLIHGDCKPSQFLISGDAVSILDFDHAGMADPANDVGTFLATLRQLAVRQSLKAHADAPSIARAAWLLALEKRFLDDYIGSSGEGDGFHLRATWYEAVGLLRKALRAFGRSPFSPLPSAMVAEAWRCLADLPPVR